MVSKEVVSNIYISYRAYNCGVMVVVARWQRMWTFLDQNGSHYMVTEYHLALLAMSTSLTGYMRIGQQYINRVPPRFTSNANKTRY